MLICWPAVRIPMLEYLVTWPVVSHTHSHTYITRRGLFSLKACWQRVKKKTCEVLTVCFFCFSGSGAGQGTIDNRIEQAMVSNRRTTLHCKIQPVEWIRIHCNADPDPGSATVSMRILMRIRIQEVKSGLRKKLKQN